MGYNGSMENPLDSLKKIFKDFGASRVNKDIVVGIDIGGAAIKVVQLKKERGRIMLDTYGEIATGPYADKAVGEVIPLDTEVLTQAVQDVIKEAGITAAYGGVSIQSSASLVFVISVPTVGAKEIEGVISTEARKYIPVPLTEVSMDWWVVPQPELVQSEVEGVKQTEVLVAAIRNDRLGMYKEIMQPTPIQRSFFEIEIFSIMRAGLHNELSAVAIIDMGASSTRVAIVQYGVVKRLRTINKGSFQITEQIRRSRSVEFAAAEELKKTVGLLGTVENGQDAVSQIVRSQLSGIWREVMDIMTRFERDYNRAISKIILTGGGSRMLGLKDFVAELYTGDIEFADPFQKVDNPPFLDEVLESTGPEFSVAVGLALKPFQ